MTFYKEKQVVQIMQWNVAFWGVNSVTDLFLNHFNKCLIENYFFFIYHFENRILAEMLYLFR